LKDDQVPMVHMDLSGEPKKLAPYDL
jgi:hypothetical protein